MKKTTLTNMLLLLFGLPLAAGNGEAAQSPHWQENDIGCLDCHADHQGTTTPCLSCHTNTGGGGYSKYNAPGVETHGSFSCLTCHDPHTSSQCSLPLVTGTFGSYYLEGGNTTFLLDSVNAVDPAWQDPAGWGEKSGSGRGLIFSVKKGLLDNRRTPPVYVDYSAEVVSAENNTITVTGIHAGSELSGGTDFTLTYGQLVRTTINNKPVILGSSRDLAANDGRAGGNDATPDGVCQVCHTQTRYWLSDGTGTNHNDGRICTDCHDHASGFAANCNGCHGNPPLVDSARPDDGLVAVPRATGSITAGAHELHASAAGYGFGCDACHSGGMPESAINDNNRIQISFGSNPTGVPAAYDGQTELVAPYAYEGVGLTSVTTGGSMTCSNVYCHSNGAWVSTGVMNPSTTPAWNTEGPLACDSCHPYPMAYGENDPRKDTHTSHAMKGYGDCGTCHYANLSDSSRHVNQHYDVVPAPTFSGRAADGEVSLSFTYSFAPGGGTCSANSCHAYWGYSDPARWGMNPDLVVTPRISALASTESDLTVIFDASRSACYEMVDGVVEERVCSYDWSFGGSGAVVGGSGEDTMVYRYDDEGEYTVSLTMTESITGKTAVDEVSVQAIIVEPPAPAADFTTSVDQGTVLLNATLPPEVVRLYVYWGDRGRSVYNADNLESMVHTYSRTGRSYSIRVMTIDSSYNRLNYTLTEDPDLAVFIP